MVHHHTVSSKATCACWPLTATSHSDQQQQNLCQWAEVYRFGRTWRWSRYDWILISFPNHFLPSCFRFL